MVRRVIHRSLELGLPVALFILAVFLLLVSRHALSGLNIKVCLVEFSNGIFICDGRSRGEKFRRRVDVLLIPIHGRVRASVFD